MTNRLNRAQADIATNKYTHIDCKDFNKHFPSGQYLGCIDAIYAVDTLNMFLTIASFSFIVFLILKPNIYYLFFVPLVEFIWVFGSEFLVQALNITLIYGEPMEGDIGITDTIFFRAHTIFIIMLIFGYFTGAFGIFLSWGIRDIKKNIVLYWLKDKSNLS